jgi:hypothetical protein
MLLLSAPAMPLLPPPAHAASEIEPAMRTNKIALLMPIPRLPRSNAATTKYTGRGTMLEARSLNGDRYTIFIANCSGYVTLAGEVSCAVINLAQTPEFRPGVLQRRYTP